MPPEINILLITSASIGLFHTLLGPDHYLPFIVMARSGKWSKIKTFWITVLCGLGHIIGSIVLGFAGIALGIAVSRIEVSCRGAQYNGSSSCCRCLLYLYDRHDARDSDARSLEHRFFARGENGAFLARAGRSSCLPVRYSNRVHGFMKVKNL